MREEESRNYTAILRAELVPAMGCTEPIAIAYAAAKAVQALGTQPEHLEVTCSGNIIKNVKGVTVPNSGGLKGIEAAAVLGAVGGDAGKGLEVISGATDEAREKTGKMLEDGVCVVNLAEDVPNLYICCEAFRSGHRSLVEIIDNHTNITRILRDGRPWKDPDRIKGEDTRSADHAGTEPGTGKKTDGEEPDYSRMTLRGIINYANMVDIAEVSDILEEQVRCNTAISQEGIDNRWGVRVGKTILENWGRDVKSLACARAAAGSDARMSGCPMPVIINSGSGNQGITVTMPVVTYAEQWYLSKEKMYRCLCVSNLVSIYIKHYIGSLSAFCGAVSAACGAGAAITYMAGGSYEEISGTITNTLGNVGGIVCDGAKPSCAAKIASSVHAALMAHYMSMSAKEFQGGEGFVRSDVEDTIKNMGYIGKIGMKETDKEILNVMIDKVDVDSSL